MAFGSRAPVPDIVLALDGLIDENGRAINDLENPQDHVAIDTTIAPWVMDEPPESPPPREPTPVPSISKLSKTLAFWPMRQNSTTSLARSTRGSDYLSVPGDGRRSTEDTASTRTITQSASGKTSELRRSKSSLFGMIKRKSSKATLKASAEEPPPLPDTQFIFNAPVNPPHPLARLIPPPPVISEKEKEKERRKREKELKKASKKNKKGSAAPKEEALFALDTNLESMEGIIDLSKVQLNLMPPSHSHSPNSQKVTFELPNGSSIGPVKFVDPFAATSSSSLQSTINRQYRTKISPTTVLPPANPVPSEPYDAERDWQPPESWAVIDSNGLQNGKVELTAFEEDGTASDGEYKERKAARLLDSNKVTVLNSRLVQLLERNDSLRPSKKGKEKEQTVPDLDEFYIRIYHGKGAFFQTAIAGSLTVHDLLPALAKRLKRGSKNASRLYIRERGKERILNGREKILLIIERRLCEAGYTWKDALLLLSGENLNFLIKFIYREPDLSSNKRRSYGSITTDPHNLAIQNKELKLETFDHVDLAGRALKAIPIILHKNAELITSLKLSRNPMIDLPLDFVQACTSLRDLRLSNMSMRKVPANIVAAEKLRRLDLTANHIKVRELDAANLHTMPELQSLYLSINLLKDLPDSYSQMPKLQTLHISNNKLGRIPPVILLIKTLTDLDVSFNEIKELPENFGDLKALERFVCIGNELKRIPDTLYYMHQLRFVDFRHNRIGDLSLIFNLPNLEAINGDHNSVHLLDISMGRKLRKLSMAHNQLTQIALYPAPLGKAPILLTELDISHASLTSLEDHIIATLESLEILKLNHNNLSYLPDSICTLSKLSTFACYDNRLIMLPKRFGELRNLAWLDLHNNNLRELPFSIWDCGSLQHLNLSSNFLSTFPTPPIIPLNPSSTKVMPVIDGKIVHLPKNYNKEHVIMDHLYPPLSFSLLTLSLSENKLVSSELGPSSSTTHSNSNSSIPTSIPFEQTLRNIAFLKSLKALNISYNEITELPYGLLREFKKLEEFWCCGNEINSLPADDVVKLDRLKCFVVSGNKLTVLPSELAKLEWLRVVDVSNNNLRYNINNYEFDWNWNFNQRLKHLSLSGNSRLQIKWDNIPTGNQLPNQLPNPNFNPNLPSSSLSPNNANINGNDRNNSNNNNNNKTKNKNKNNTTTGFSSLTRIRNLGLIDVTVIPPPPPSQSQSQPQSQRQQNQTQIQTQTQTSNLNMLTSPSTMLPSGLSGVPSGLSNSIATAFSRNRSAKAAAAAAAKAQKEKEKEKAKAAKAKAKLEEKEREKAFKKSGGIGIGGGGGGGGKSKGVMGIGLSTSLSVGAGIGIGSGVGGLGTSRIGNVNTVCVRDDKRIPCSQRLSNTNTGIGIGIGTGSAIAAAIRNGTYPRTRIVAGSRIPGNRTPGINRTGTGTITGTIRNRNKTQNKTQTRTKTKTRRSKKQQLIATGIPSDGQNRRVRVTGSNVAGMAYGVSDCLGKKDSELTMLDVVYEFPVPVKKPKLTLQEKEAREREREKEREKEKEKTKEKEKEREKWKMKISGKEKSKEKNKLMWMMMTAKAREREEEKKILREREQERERVREKKERLKAEARERERVEEEEDDENIPDPPKRALFGIFGNTFAPKALPVGIPPSRHAKFLKDNFVDMFIEQMEHKELQEHEEMAVDALRRTFLGLHQAIHNMMFMSPHQKVLARRRKEPLSTLAGARSHSFFGPRGIIGSRMEGMELGGRLSHIDPVTARGGASGLVVYVEGTKLIAANVGTAVGVIARKNVPHIVGRKHDPWNEAELARIRKSEGWISPDGLVQEEAPVSRSFGYYHLLPVVNASPDILVWDIADTDDFLILANDGLWNHVPYQMAVDITSRLEDPMVIAQKLRDVAVSFGSEGSVMVMVLRLRDVHRPNQPHNPMDVMSPTMYTPKLPRGLVVDKSVRNAEPEVAPPTGNLALVFTDIKNSTHLWETNPSMPSAMNVHNDFMRRRLRDCGGYEFKTEGDAFLCSFPRVLNAVWFCLAVQAQLLELDWPEEILQVEDGKVRHDKQGRMIGRGVSVRMGIHAGTPMSIQDPVTHRMDYMGPVINRAARVSSLADGGQIFCSEGVMAEINASVLGTGPATPWSQFQSQKAIDAIKSFNPVLIDVGPKKMKGLEVPENITAIYPSGLEGRHEFAVDMPNEYLDFEDVQKIGLVCLRLEMLVTGRIFKVEYGPQYKAQEKNAAPPEINVDGADPNHLWTDVKRDPKCLLPVLTDRSTDDELHFVLDTFTFRIQNAIRGIIKRFQPERINAREMLDILEEKGVNLRTLALLQDFLDIID